MWTIQTCLSSIVSMLAWDRIIKKKNEKEITPFPHGNIQSVPCASILRLTNNAPKQQYYNNETFWKTKTHHLVVFLMIPGMGRSMLVGGVT